MEIHGIVTQPRLVFHVTTLNKRRPITIMGAEFRFLWSPSCPPGGNFCTDGGCN